MSIQAIETVYNGYRFRSRLEARWAVFFDTLGIPYEYEKEGYDLDGTWYLPDFWLPELDCFIEIKGPDHDDISYQSGEAFDKMLALAAAMKKEVYLFAGSDFRLFRMTGVDKRHPDRYPCEGIWAKSAYPQEMTEEERIRFKLKWNANSDGPYVWGQCPVCYKVEIIRFMLECPDDPSGAWCPSRGHAKLLMFDTPHLIAAYTAARQARFEHGETPKVGMR